MTVSPIGIRRWYHGSTIRRGIFHRGAASFVRSRSIWSVARHYCEAMVTSHRTGTQELSSLSDRTTPPTVASRKSQRGDLSPILGVAAASGLGGIVGFDLLHVFRQSVHETQIVTMCTNSKRMQFTTARR